MNNYYQYSDEKLISLLREKSPVCDQTFDVIFNKYSKKLNSYCIFKSENAEDAEEIFEDTWLKFLDRIKKGKQLDSILPYLFTIARTLIIDKYRKQSSQKNIKIEYKDINDLDELINPFQFQSFMENEELISLIKIAVSNLDDIYKESFVMYWFGGLTHNEIADILGINTGNVKMRCHRALSELIKNLKPFLIENN